METSINRETLQQEITSTLPHFSGTLNYYHHQTFGYGFMSLTDGAFYIREKCQAYWFCDLILSHQAKLQGESFQNWDLSKSSNGTWVVTCTNGIDETPIVSQDLNYSDFPLDKGISLFLIDNVLMLPQEY